MTRVICHSEDCPVLCTRSLNTPSGKCYSNHKSHACPPCSGAGMVAVEREKLEELRNAAIDALNHTDPTGGIANNLRRAIAAFRAEPEADEKYPLNRGD